MSRSKQRCLLESNLEKGMRQTTGTSETLGLAILEFGNASQ